MPTRFIITGEIEFDRPMDELDHNEIEIHLATELEALVDSFDPDASWVSIVPEED